MTLDVFLLILRLLGIVLLYLFLMQVIISITRDLHKTANVSDDARNKAPRIVGQLIVVDSGPSQIAPGTAYNLTPEATIGRGPTNTVQISESFVSAEHTRLLFRNGEWHIQDMDSKNGTFLNNQPARKDHPAHFGDILRVGFISFKLVPVDERMRGWSR